jgi:hypothetical protein
MIRQHAILSWSGAHIWLKCAPSARFQEQIPEENSIYSEEGTLAHDLGALILDYYIGTFAGREDDFTNEYNAKYLEVYNWYINNYPQEDPKGLSDAMCEHAQGYALFVFSIGGKILVEETLDLSRFAPLSWGTGDGLNFFPVVIYVNDFKYGAGKRVYADENDQLMGYALGAYLRAVEMGYDPHTVVMNIIQPRMSSEPSSAQISVTDLLEWAAVVVAPMAKLAIAGQGAFVPGETQCQFCKARTVCAAFYGKFGEAWNLQDGRVITAEQRAFVLTYGDALINYIKAMKGDAIKRLKAREVIPGFKLIGTLGDRRFTDEIAVATVLTDMGYTIDQVFKPSQIKGITELEALLKKKAFNEVLGPYIIRPEGNPKLVSEDHKSPAIGAAAANLYDAPDYSQIN